MPVARCESAGSMRKAGGLAGVGEGEREGTSFQQNSTDQRFRTALCRVFQQNSASFQQNSTSFQQNSTSFQQNSTDQRFKTALCRVFQQN